MALIKSVRGFTPKIGKDTFLADNATIIGDVEIGEGCSIWFGSKVVITGDVTQIDLPSDKVSGLKDAMKVLRDVEGVSVCKLTKEDVVRHVMVQRIIEAYAKYEEKKK